jgi:hypothetical protein
MYYVGDALTELKPIKATPDGHLDFTTLPAFATHERETVIPEEQLVTQPEVLGGMTPEEVLVVEVVLERDLGAMISMLTVAVQQLEERVLPTIKPTAPTVPTPTSAPLVNNTGGTADTTLVAIGTTFNRETIQGNFADVAIMTNKNTADIVALEKSIDDLVVALKTAGVLV